MYVLTAYYLVKLVMSKYVGEAGADSDAGNTACNTNVAMVCIMQLSDTVTRYSRMCASSQKWVEAQRYPANTGEWSLLCFVISTFFALDHCAVATKSPISHPPLSQRHQRLHNSLSASVLQTPLTLLLLIIVTRDWYAPSLPEKKTGKNHTYWHTLIWVWRSTSPISAQHASKACINLD